MTFEDLQQRLVSQHKSRLKLWCFATVIMGLFLAPLCGMTVSPGVSFKSTIFVETGSSIVDQQPVFDLMCEGSIDCRDFSKRSIYAEFDQEIQKETPLAEHLMFIDTGSFIPPSNHFFRGASGLPAKKPPRLEPFA